ncbi:MAG: SDR family NAD(P)-dependent oxidoreductase [Paracoccaceae bacterium]
MEALHTEQRALILGHSGGIGTALSRALFGKGYEVTGLSRAQDGLDVTDPASLSMNMNALTGPFDLIIVATGILAPPGKSPEKSLRAIEATDMAYVMAVNAIGPALVLQHVPDLLPRDRRSVVAVLTARVGSITDNKTGGWYSYRASKAAANQIVRGAAIEVARKRKDAIIVALHPGTVDTPFTANYPAHAKHSPDTAATHMLDVLEGLTPDQTGQFFDSRGDEIPW